MSKGKGGPRFPLNIMPMVALLANQTKGEVGDLGSIPPG